MPVLCKIFESVLNSRISFRNIVLEKEDNIQFCFKTHHRTNDKLFIVNSLNTLQKIHKRTLSVCFVDFSKEFDYINRYALYYKLFFFKLHQW